MKFNYNSKFNSSATSTSFNFAPPLPSKRVRENKDSDRYNSKIEIEYEDTDLNENHKKQSAVRLKSHLRSRIETNAMKRYTNFYHGKSENQYIETVSDHNIKALLGILKREKKS